MSSRNWRSKFIELSESLFRELGFSPPSMLHEESLPLAMELELEGLHFELLHSSSELPDKVLIICKLGKMPSSNEIHGIQELMKGNLVRLRTHAEWYGLSSQDRQIHMMYHLELEKLSAPEALQQMKKMISDSNEWQSRFFESPHLQEVQSMDISKSILA